MLSSKLPLLVLLSLFLCSSTLTQVVSPSHRWTETARRGASTAFPRSSPRNFPLHSSASRFPNPPSTAAPSVSSSLPSPQPSDVWFGYLPIPTVYSDRQRVLYAGCMGTRYGPGSAANVVLAMDVDSMRLRPGFNLSLASGLDIIDMMIADGESWTLFLKATDIDSPLPRTNYIVRVDDKGRILTQLKLPQYVALLGVDREGSSMLTTVPFSNQLTLLDAVSGKQKAAYDAACPSSALAAALCTLLLAMSG